MTELNMEQIDDQLDETETLIGRVSANDAREQDWRRFESIAQVRPGAWEHMARALREELVVRSALDDVTAPSEAIDLPPMPIRGSHRLAALQAWPGWALAAAIALAWCVSFFNPPQRDTQETGLGSSILPTRLSADEAFNDYLTLGAREGRVLQELPMMMVESRFDSRQGRVEVVYVRQLLERTTVQSAVELTEDALGRPSTIPVELNILQTNRPL